MVNIQNMERLKLPRGNEIKQVDVSFPPPRTRSPQEQATRPPFSRCPGRIIRQASLKRVPMKKGFQPASSA